MFLRSTTRIKDGKRHRYFSVVESVRTSASKQPFQRTLLYLGEINSEQEANWTKAIEVFDTRSNQQERLCLFASDRSLPAVLPSPAVQIQLHEYRLSSDATAGAR